MMFTPAYRQEFESLYLQISKSSNIPKSSSLLRTYALIYALKKCEASSAEETIRLIHSTYDGYSYVLSNERNYRALLEAQEITQQFMNLSLHEFLKYVVPDIVCEPNRLKDYRSSFDMDDAQLVHHILRIRHIFYLEMETPSIYKTDHELQKLDHKDKLFCFYCRHETRHPLCKKDFLKLYEAINSLKLDADYLSPRLLMGHPKKHIEAALNVLFDQLQLSAAQCFETIHAFWVQKKQAKNLVEMIAPSQFASIKSEAARRKLFAEAISHMAHVTPLEMICAVSTRKKQGSVDMKRYTESLVPPNDVKLECSLIYNVFSSSVIPKSEEDIAIFFPSACFVRNILHDNTHYDHRISFIFGDNNIADILKSQAEEGTSAPHIGPYFEFIGYNKWLQQRNKSGKKYTHILIFGSSFTYTQREEIYPEILASCEPNAVIYALEASESIENRNNFFCNNPLLDSLEIALIPQGINNSTTPRRKVLIACHVSKAGEKREENTSTIAKLFAYTLNTTLSTQAISPMLKEPVIIDVRDFDSRKNTLRRVYAQELINRHSSGRSRVASVPYDFTPDIQIWCSKTYPPNNRNRPRLEAYICEPALEDNLNSGSKERGKIIQCTKKHTTKIYDEDIVHWLEWEYPLDKIIKRTSANSKRPSEANANSVVSIREEISRRYCEYLKGKNIALKTLWYLYPNLEDSYSKTSYQMLGEMMTTAIGQKRVGDLTAEECESLLINVYPDLSHDELWSRFAIISTAIDMAVTHGYCEANDLRQVLRQAKRKDKLFTQVRRALTKTHFLKKEFQQAYKFCMDKLSEGEIGYLGVLIRLMTGLESSIVCALRWSDMIYHPDFDFYSFIIIRQVDNAGNIIGFRNAEDYLCFPISKNLLRVLLQYKEKVGKNREEDCIVGANFSNVTQKNTTPKALNELTKTMITTIGISERKVLLPDPNLGHRETDLNKYQGDFVRENFRFWTVNSGKMNADELAYLLRNKPCTTLGTFYCDFLNDASQLILQIKLNRMETALYDGENEESKVYHTAKQPQYYREISASPACGKTIWMEVSASAHAKGLVQLSTAYGLCAESTILNESEE